MNRRIQVLTGVVLLAGLSGALTQSSAAPTARESRSRACLTTGTTVGANRTLRVYRVGDRNGHRYVACVVRTGRRRLLGESNSLSGGVEDVKIAGRYAAVSFGQCGRDSCLSVAAVTDVLTGRTRAGKHRSDVGIASLVLSRTGSIAWITQTTAKDHFEVRKLEGSQETMLGAGSTIVPDSLALAGRRIYWLENDQPVSAVLQ